MASLVTNYSEKYFATSIKNWVLISWVFQTLGILVNDLGLLRAWLGWFLVLGSVENASLLPWFATTALFHFNSFRKKLTIFLGNYFMSNDIYIKCDWYFFS